MNSLIALRRVFRDVIAKSLNGDQINYIGQRVNGSFDVYRESGFSPKLSIPSDAAVDALIRFFPKEEDLVNFITEMFILEGKKISQVTVQVHNKDSIIRALEKNKWFFDSGKKTFFREKFFEDRINFLNSIRVLDLRDESKNKEIVENLSKFTETLQMDDLEWQVTVRLFSMNQANQKILRQVIELLLKQQDLTDFVFVFYTCLKELAINASKANYKTLYEKYHTRSLNITMQNNYDEFLSMFKQEIDENGEKNLLKMAEKANSFINIIFISTSKSISVWVSNQSNITNIEKANLMSKINDGDLNESMKKKESGQEDKHTEGAGLGLMLALNLLRQFSKDPRPLKVIFYPTYIKIGFEIKRSELLEHSKIQYDEFGVIIEPET